MAYSDYLPTEAILGFPITQRNHSLSIVDNIEVGESQIMYLPQQLFAFDATYGAGVWSHSTPQYVGTYVSDVWSNKDTPYNTGDMVYHKGSVYMSDKGNNYDEPPGGIASWSVVSGGDCSVWSDFESYNKGDVVYLFGYYPLFFKSVTDGNTSYPLEKNEYGVLTKIPSEWVVAGMKPELIASNGSNMTYYKACYGQGLMIKTFPFVPDTTGYPQNSVYSGEVGLYLGGVSAHAILVEVYNHDDTLADSFMVDMQTRSSLTLIAREEGQYFIVYLYPSGGTPLSIFNDHVKVTTCIIFSPVTLGSPLLGYTTSRRGEYKTVLSEGVEKTYTAKAYDTFSGQLKVSAADYQKVKYALSKAVEGDYLFHIGTGSEIYDQEVFFGRIEHQIPIDDNSDLYKIKVSGQSLANFVDNPFISSDLSDGVPV